MPAIAVEGQFPDNVRQHLRHSMQRIGEQLARPWVADGGAGREIGLIDSHDNDEIRGTSQQRPILEAIEVVILILIAELVQERDAIQLVQGTQGGPDALIKGGKLLLDIGIGTIDAL